MHALLSFGRGRVGADAGCPRCILNQRAMAPWLSSCCANVKDIHLIICHKRSWRLESLLDDRPLPSPLALAGQLGEQVSSGILLSRDMHQLKCGESSLQRLDMPQIRSHLWILCLVLPRYFSCDQLGITLRQEALSAHFFGQEHSSNQRLVLRLVIAYFESEA